MVLGFRDSVAAFQGLEFRVWGLRALSSGFRV